MTKNNAETYHKNYHNAEVALEDLVKNLATQGPGVAVLVAVFFYFAKVLIPGLQGQVDRLLNDFRSDLAEIRQSFREELAAERKNHEDAVDKVVQAIQNLSLNSRKPS